MTGTTSSPPLTGKVPPVVKQFCTSTTISTLLASGLMLAARAARPNRPAVAIKLTLVKVFNKFLRFAGYMLRSPLNK